MVEVYVKLIESKMRTLKSVEEKVPHLIEAIKKRLIEDGYSFD